MTEATVHGGSASRGASLELQPQLQVAKQLAVFVTSAITFLDADGVAVSRTSIPLRLGAVATLHHGDVVLVDVAASYTLTNPFGTGPALAPTGFGGTARLVF